MMKSGALPEAIYSAFVSPNEEDRNLEPANVVDVVARTARAVEKLANAITPLGAGPYIRGPARVDSLTEAVIGIMEQAERAADGLSEIASALGGGLSEIASALGSGLSEIASTFQPKS